MKSKKWLALTIFCALILGGIGGSIAGLYLASKLEGESRMVALMNRSVAETKVGIALLRHIRNGNVDKALSKLEMELDANIVTLSSVRPAQYEDGGDLVNSALKAAKEYRTQHPWLSGNLDMDKAVAQAFSQIVDD
jgi:hypothetical protein